MLRVRLVIVARMIVVIVGAVPMVVVIGSMRVGVGMLVMSYGDGGCRGGSGGVGGGGLVAAWEGRGLNFDTDIDRHGLGLHGGVVVQVIVAHGVEVRAAFVALWASVVVRAVVICPAKKIARKWVINRNGRLHHRVVTVLRIAGGRPDRRGWRR